MFLEHNSKYLLCYWKIFIQWCLLTAPPEVFAPLIALASTNRCGPMSDVSKHRRTFGLGRQRSARFNISHKTTAHERPTLSTPGSTWRKRKADAFAPAIDELQMKNVRIKTSGTPALAQNRTLSDVLRNHKLTIFLWYYFHLPNQLVQHQTL